jgi:hypothetical protein
MTDLIHAPWTTEQVTALNAFQHRGRMHPFTCGATHASGQSPVLVATNSGWVCPDPQCVYRQDWAHAFMAEHLARTVPVSPADQTTDRAALRQRIAEALGREDAHNAGYDHGFVSQYGVDAETDGFIDAVLAVLPEPADRAAECPQCGNTGACNGGPCPLRRLAAEAPTTTQPKAQAAETPSMRLAQASMNAMADAITGARQDGAHPWPCTCDHPADAHSVYGCEDGCACEWMPKGARRG